jgi:hypothetical protein
MRLVAVVCVAAVLSGCGVVRAVQNQQSEERNKERLATMNAEEAACVQRRKSGELHSYVESASCVNEAMLRGMSDIRYPYMDLVYTVAATRLRGATQVDAGTITETELTVRMQETAARVLNEARERREGAHVARQSG